MVDSNDSNLRQMSDVYPDEDLPTHYAFEMLDEDKTWWDSTMTGKIDTHLLILISITVLVSYYLRYIQSIRYIYY